MKIKLTNICWEERKERKEKRNRYAKLNTCRVRRFIYIKDLLQGEKNSRKGKQMNNCRKNIIGFQKLKIKMIKKEKKNTEEERKKGKERKKLLRTAKVQRRGRGL